VVNVHGSLAPTSKFNQTEKRGEPRGGGRQRKDVPAERGVDVMLSGPVIHVGPRTVACDQGD